VTKRFKIRGEKRLAELYMLKMAVERTSRLQKLSLMENPKWRRVVFRGIGICDSKTKNGKTMRRVVEKLGMGEPLSDLSTLEAEALLSMKSRRQSSSLSARYGAKIIFEPKFLLKLL
jgi:hypothetical protein